MRYSLALILALSSCSPASPPPPPEIRRADVAGDHQEIVVFVTDTAATTDLLPAIAAGVKLGRARLAPGARTITFDFRFIRDGDQAEQPLATIDYDRAGLERVTDATPAAELLELAREARARAPIGDREIGRECAGAETALRTSRLCAGAAG